MATANTPLRHACFRPRNTRSRARKPPRSRASRLRPRCRRHPPAALRPGPNFQTSGQLPEAAYQYKLFISNALLQLAFNRTKAGDFRQSLEYFDAASALEPADIGLQLEYAEAALAAHDLDKRAPSRKPS